MNVKVAAWNEELHLYPFVADWLFGRSLHFVTRLELLPEDVSLQLSHQAEATHHQQRA
jgi:hypothetical protein